MSGMVGGMKLCFLCTVVYLSGHVKSADVLKWEIFGILVGSEEGEGWGYPAVVFIISFMSRL